MTLSERSLLLVAEMELAEVLFCCNQTIIRGTIRKKLMLFILQPGLFS